MERRGARLVLGGLIALALGLPALRGDAGAEPALLTDPFLQLPTADAVHVVWFTAERGQDHQVEIGSDFSIRFPATTTRMSRTQEDATTPTPRAVWRHEARVNGLPAGERTPYRVRSVLTGGTVLSEAYTLAPLPPEGAPLRILLTSDHQLKPMVAANLQKAMETAGPFDAVFFAGDMVNVADRASEWFDDDRGTAFFPNMQGHTQRRIPEGESGRIYTGASILQEAPLFTVIGNHEVMGRWSSRGLTAQSSDFMPRMPSQTQAPEGRFFNTITYEEIVTLPTESPGGEQYYAVRFGDVFLVGLYAARAWREPGTGPEVRGRYREADADLTNPAAWGGGSFLFEDLTEGSPQHTWLREQLASPACTTARFRVVMLHHSVHGLGVNSVPVLAEPVPVTTSNENGELTAIRYEYPLQDDVWRRDVEPWLHASGVDLVLCGHSHLWNRFRERKLNTLETANVGNSYGAFLAGGEERTEVPVPDGWDMAHYPLTGDPHGLRPVPPTLFSPQVDAAGEPLPYVASNTLTVFSVLDTGMRAVRSFVFDTANPEAGVREFDRFNLGR